MENEITTWLLDVKLAIDEINEFMSGSKDFLKFRKDTKTKRAVERNIEIIGEAINRILDLEPNISITKARKIVDTRNRIIHGYDTVSDDIIWLIVTKEIPLLKNEIDVLLKNN